MGKRIIVSLAALFSIITIAAAQDLKITGTVVDVGGNPLVGAAIVSNSGTGVVTDYEGHYLMYAKSDGELTVSFLGFKQIKVKVDGRKTIDFVLEEDTSYLDEVTVVAFGTKRKQDLVGSVSSVKKDIIKNSAASSVTNALEGTVAGLQIVSSTGQPGSDAAIVVRGIGSLSAGNAALIVVDGVPYNGKLSEINPADIESISVSKDAVSNSLYGSRAASGVVMVTTKKGSKERTTINVNANWGSVNRAYKDYDMVTDPGEYYRMSWYGLRNTEYIKAVGALENPTEEALAAAAAAASQLASQTLLDEMGGYNSFIIPEGEFLVDPEGNLNPNRKVRYDDTFADSMFQKALRQEYNVSASGGNEKTDYYLSLGMLDNQSYIKSSSFRRFTGRANINTQLRKWLRVGVNVGYSNTTNKGLQEGSGLASNPFGVARGWAPIFPVHAYDAEGNMKYNPDGTPMWDAGTGMTDGTTERPTATNQNVICNLNEDIRKTRRNSIQTKAFAEITFLKDFKFVVTGSYDYTDIAKTTYYTPTIGDGQSFGGRGTKYSAHFSTMNLSEILSYDKHFGDNHYITAKIGHEYYRYQDDYLQGQKTKFFDPMNPELDNGGQMESINSSTNLHNIEGFFGMVDYNYASRYYVSAAYRRDGTSRFLKRWGDFWSVGAAWRLSAEPWMKNASHILTNFKIRASYGTQGNENMDVVGFTPYTDQYGVTWDGKQLGYSTIFYGNPDLTWEKQNTFDVGIDFSFIDRIHGSLDYFIRWTNDMIFQRPLAQSTGRPYNWENIGSMQNSGVELDLNFDIVKMRDYKFTIGLVGSHYQNKILTLPEENKEEGITRGTFKLMEGKSMYEYYTYKYAGMTENGQAQWYKDEEDEDGNPTGNVVKTSKYSEATKYWLDKEALADFSGGLNLSLYAKGVDFSMATAFQIGGWAYDSEYISNMSSSFYVGHHKDMWKTFDPIAKTGTLPAWDSNNNSNSYNQTSDAHLVKASYFGIKNLTIGYSLPRKWMSKLGMGGIRIYFTADNVALFSARRGFDPRVSIDGNNGGFGGYSPLRTLSGGINLTF